MTVTAAIKINGSLGSREDITLGSTVTLTNNDDTGVVSWNWTLLPPPGSGAGLSSATSSSPSFIADVVGSYLITLTVSDGGSSTDLDSVVAAVKTSNLQFRIPSAGEKTEFGDSYGWAEAFYNFSITVDTNFFKKDGTIALTGNPNIDGYRITNVGTPTSSGDAINKTYADSKVNGITISGTPSDNQVMIFNNGTGNVEWTTATFDAYNFKVSSNDTTPGFVENKFTAGSNVQFTTLNDGANESFKISVNLDSYAQKILLDSYATTTSLNDYAQKTLLDSYATTTSLNDYAQKTLLDAYANLTDLFKVKISSNDTTDGYLGSKVSAGLNVVLTQLNDGSNESLQIATTEYIKLTEQGSDPVTHSNDGYLYTKDDSGDTELYYLDSNGNIVQITKDGGLNADPVTLDQAYDGTGGSGSGRVITVDSGPVDLNASGGFALDIDGYIGLAEIASDPTTRANYGFLYTKDDATDTELFYKDANGNVVQMTLDGYINGGALSGGNTLDKAYDEGGPGIGRTITADAGPVEINASGNASLSLDGYITLSEISDPSALGNSGSLYSKDIDGYSELFYINNYGSITQITEDGYLAGTSNVAQDDLDSSGTETSISLSYTPLSTSDTPSGRDLQVYRNGILLRWISVLTADPNRWTYNSGLNRVEFAASGSSDWYTAIYNKR